MGRAESRWPIALPLRVPAPVEQGRSVDVSAFMVAKLAVLVIGNDDTIFEGDLCVRMARNDAIGHWNALHNTLHAQCLAADKLSTATAMRVVNTVNNRGAMAGILSEPDFHTHDSGGVITPPLIRE